MPLRSVSSDVLVRRLARAFACDAATGRTWALVGFLLMLASLSVRADAPPDSRNPIARWQALFSAYPNDDVPATSRPTDPALATGEGGSWLSGFHLPGLDGQVTAAVEYHGDLVVAGGFKHVNATPAFRLARCHRGTWTGLGVGTNGLVTSLAIYRGDLIAAGRFTEAGGIPARGIARWDGTAWHPLGAGIVAHADGGVLCLCVYRDRLYAGGLLVGSEGVDAEGVLSWDGSSWSATSLELVSRDAVHTMAVTADELFLAHSEIARPGHSGGGRPIAARFDGGRWFGANGKDAILDPEVLGIWQQELVGYGYLDQYPEDSGYAVARFRDGDWKPLQIFDDNLWTEFLCDRGGELFVVAVESPDPSLAEGIWRWDGVRFQPLLNTPLASVDAIAAVGGVLVASGRLPDGGRQAPVTIQVMRGTAWSSILDPTPGLGLRGDVRALSGGTEPLLVLGGGSYSGAISEENAAVRSAGAWRHLPRQADVLPGDWNGTPQTATYLDGAPLVSGEFAWGRAEQRGLATWRGGQWDPIVLESDIRSTLTADDGLVIGGGFTAVNGNSAHNLARYVAGQWRPLGGSEPPVAVDAVVAHRGNYLIGGVVARGPAWNQVTSRAYERRASRWEELGTDLPFRLRTFLDYAGTPIAVGNMSPPVEMPVPRGQVALLERGRWVVLPEPFDGTLNDAIVYRGELYVAGSFTHIGNRPFSGIARWNGLSWAPVGDGVDGAVFDLALRGDTLYAGGAFRSAGEAGSASIGAWLLPRETTFPFSARTSEEAIVLEWTNPSSSQFRGTIVRVTDGDKPPLSPTDGEPVANRNNGRFPGVPGAPMQFVDRVPRDGRVRRYAAFAMFRDGSVPAARGAVAGLTVGAPVAASAIAEDHGIRVSWRPPDDPTVRRVAVRFSETGFPESVEEGTPLPNGSNGVFSAAAGAPSEFWHGSLRSSTTYYYSVFSLSDDGFSSVPARAARLLDYVPPFFDFNYERTVFPLGEFSISIGGSEALGEAGADLTIDGVDVPFSRVYAGSEPPAWEAHWDYLEEGAHRVEMCGTDLSDQHGCTTSYFVSGRLHGREQATFQMPDDAARLEVSPDDGAEGSLFVFWPKSEGSAVRTAYELAPAGFSIPPTKVTLPLPALWADLAPADRWTIQGPDGILEGCWVDPGAGIVWGQANLSGVFRVRDLDHPVSHVVDPTFLQLDPPRPNPSRAEVSLNFEVRAPQHLRALLYDASGREVAVLFDGAVGLGPGLITWDGRSKSGARTPAGVFWLRLESERARATTRILRLR